MQKGFVIDTGCGFASFPSLRPPMMNVPGSILLKTISNSGIEGQPRAERVLGGGDSGTGLASGVVSRGAGVVSAGPEGISAGSGVGSTVPVFGSVILGRLGIRKYPPVPRHSASRRVPATTV